MGRGTAAVGAVVVCAAGLLLPGCAAAEVGEGEGGFGLPTVAPGDVPGERVVLRGAAHVEDNGCFTWTDDDDDGGDRGERRWIVWPAEAQHDGDEVRLADGTSVGEGDRLTGTGLRADADVLPGWENADSWLGAFGRYCGADVRGVVVLDDARLPTGP